MDYLLEIKLGCLVGLLILTVIFGLIPARLQWFRDNAGTDTHRMILSFISCLAGGVFLAACLLDVVPDYLADINDELKRQNVTMDFPLPEFIMAAGFFLVLIIERIVLDCSEHSSAEKLPLLSPTSSVNVHDYSSSSQHQHDHGDHHHHSNSGHHHLSSIDHHRHSQSYNAEDLETGGHHIHVDFYAHSTFRSFILFLSLSLHSVFEGLAIGLQDSESKAVQICIAILIHKSIIVFSLALKLNQSKVRPDFMVAYIVLFALMSPLGIAVGIGVMQTQGSGDGLAQCILEGIAAGTFVYITFLEILPHELNSSEQRLLSVLFVLIGFSIMVGLSFIA